LPGWPPASQLMQDAKAVTLTYHLFDNEPEAADWLRQVK
jgi:hypothetical protein